MDVRKNFPHLATLILTIAAVAVLACPARGAPDDMQDLIRKITASAGSRLKAAALLLKAAGDLSDEPAAQIALCEKACEYGMLGPSGYASAVGALDMLDKLAPDRMATWRAKRIVVYEQRYYRGPRSHRATNGRALVTLQIAEAKRLGEGNKWQQAATLLRKAHNTARALKLGDAKSIGEQLRGATALQMVHNRIGRLKADLAKAPADTYTRTQLVKLHLISLDWPEEAAKYLNATCDLSLRMHIAMATKEASELADADFLTLGLWYQSLAETATARDGRLMLVRAKENLDRFLEVHTKADPQRLKAANALKAIRVKLPDLFAAPLPKGRVVFLTFEPETFASSEGKRYVRGAEGTTLRGVVVGGKTARRGEGTAMVFDGKSYINMGNPAALQITGDKTVCMWINPANLSDRQNPINKAYGGEGTWTLEISGTINMFYGSSGRDQSPYEGYNTSRAIRVGTWTHVALVRNFKAKTVTWYVNGKVTASKATRHSCKASRAHLLIGKGYVRNFQGMLDDVGIFNRALSAKEILQVSGLDRN